VVARSFASAFSVLPAARAVSFLGAYIGLTPDDLVRLDQMNARSEQHDGQVLTSESGICSYGSPQMMRRELKIHLTRDLGKCDAAWTR
jgi:hypothetical protein